MSAVEFKVESASGCREPNIKNTIRDIDLGIPLFQAYLITHLTSGKVYIGITSRALRNRWNEHLYESRRKRSVMTISRAIADHGAENFSMESVCCASNWEDICAIEVILIEQYNCRAPLGYNLREGGQGAYGVERSADSIERSAAKHRGKPCHPNTIAAATRTHSGKPKSAEQRYRISIARMGKPRSEATKEKLRIYWASRRAAGEFKTNEPYAHARKPASAMIAKIPAPLSRHIARVWKPNREMAPDLFG